MRYVHAYSIIIIKWYIGDIITLFMQIKHIPVQTANILPKGLLQYVDRGTLELCLHLIVLALSMVCEIVYITIFVYVELVNSTYSQLLCYTHFMKYGFTYFKHWSSS